MTTTTSAAHIDELMEYDTTTLPPDGGERFNRLIFAQSPYLLQHAENPVNWYEWGEAAFSAAREENRPILLSIGYATCHWCHVMAHESFEDREVAALLNRHFICIKVDREERPDIDDFYMTVSQVMTGSGGWPLNILMAPDKRPFFAMTYLPKRTANGMRGLMELLAGIATLWRQQPDKIENNCAAIMENLEQVAEPLPQEPVDLAELQDEALQQLSDSFDQEYGGFGTSPKFPLPLTINWLLQQGKNGSREALDMALHTLNMIRRGGIWDQLGSGLHRYSVDQQWLVPHFEKMLYDQAQLAQVALQAYSITNDEQQLAMALEIFGFVLCDMTSEQGGFYTAYDADSEGEEGRFYTWSWDQIEEILGNNAELFCHLYGVTRYGNFESMNILHQAVDLHEYCSRNNLEYEVIAELQEDCRMTLLEQRNNRVAPLCDKKIITALNGLMIAALAQGGRISGIASYTDKAAKAADFILSNLKRSDGRLLRSYLKTPSPTPAFMEDYACLIHGLIELYQATNEVRWRDEALYLTGEMQRLFHRPELARYNKTGFDAEQMLLPATLEHDGVMPSPFSLAASNCVTLAELCQRPELIDHAHILIDSTLHDTRRHPTAHLGTLLVLERLELQ